LIRSARLRFRSAESLEAGKSEADAFVSLNSIGAGAVSRSDADPGVDPLA